LTASHCHHILYLTSGKRASTNGEVLIQKNPSTSIIALRHRSNNSNNRVEEYLVSQEIRDIATKFPHSISNGVGNNNNSNKTPHQRVANQGRLI